MAEPLDFSQRAHLDEEMDGPCSCDDLRVCLRNLAVLNRLTGAHRPVMQWLDSLAAEYATNGVTNSRLPRPLRIVDFGCGYGDMLRRIERWAAARGVAVELLGVDINANAIRIARAATPASSAIRWSNAGLASCPEAADIAIASGMTHHLAESEIVALLQWMERTASVGWIVVDLHRKPVPYAVFGAAMRGPWWHRFIRPDGLRSIRRSFLAEDWQRLCAAAGLRPGHIEICTHRPARLCVRRTKQC